MKEQPGREGEEHQQNKGETIFSSGGFEVHSYEMPKPEPGEDSFTVLMRSDFYQDLTLGADRRYRRELTEAGTPLPARLIDVEDPQVSEALASKPRGNLQESHSYLLHMLPQLRLRQRVKLLMSLPLEEYEAFTTYRRRIHQEITDEVRQRSPVVKPDVISQVIGRLEDDADRFARGLEETRLDERGVKERRVWMEQDGEYPLVLDASLDLEETRMTQGDTPQS